MAKFDTMRNIQGFTLVEIIVVVTIIAIISAVVFMNFRGGNESLALERAANKIAQDIRRASGLALGTNPSVAGFCFGVNVVSGYGLHFHKMSYPTSYLLYANCESSGHNCSTSGSNCDEGYSVGIDVEVEEIKLESPVEVLDTVDLGGPNPIPQLDVVFFPPDPRVKLCHVNPCGTDIKNAEITIRLQTDTTQTRTITINEKGKADIN